MTQYGFFQAGRYEFARSEHPEIEVDGRGSRRVALVEALLEICDLSRIQILCLIDPGDEAGTGTAAGCFA
ncbi:hypothetical protein [Streptomyces cacaoi]|uniref:hypothetical protein n=1 Tax=Streptomyces cacaoi TaxID=1898 RepID=UPI003318C2E9